MKKQVAILSCALMLMASPLAAQTGSGSGSGSGSASGSGSGSSQSSSSSQTQTTTTTKDGKATTQTTVRNDELGPKFVRTLTNVQVELNLSDQIGTQTPEKRTVSMIVSSGNWGKVRSSGTVVVVGNPPYGVELNVDARPFVSLEGQIQLEMTVNYAPSRGEDEPNPRGKQFQRPAGINLSQTVVLASGKPLVVSQAADPMLDRKVIVEVKATVLKQ